MQGLCLFQLESEASVLCYAAPPRDESLDWERLDACQKRCTAKDKKKRVLYFTNSYELSLTASKQYYWKDTDILSMTLPPPLPSPYGPSLFSSASNQANANTLYEHLWRSSFVVETASAHSKYSSSNCFSLILIDKRKFTWKSGSRGGTAVYSSGIL